MISTATEPRQATPNLLHRVARLLVVSLLAVSLLEAGACSSKAMDDARRGITTPGFAAPPTLTGNAPAAAPRQIVQIEPDPERDAQIDSLLKVALEDLRSGEIQDALDALTEAQSIEGWVRSENAPAILFWIGHSYDQLGERNAAMGAFRRIPIQYPRSAFADRASRRLRELRTRVPQEK